MRRLRTGKHNRTCPTVKLSGSQFATKIDGSFFWVLNDVKINILANFLYKYIILLHFFAYHCLQKGKYWNVYKKETVLPHREMRMISRPRSISTYLELCMYISWWKLVGGVQLEWYRYSNCVRVYFSVQYTWTCGIEIERAKTTFPVLFFDSLWTSNERYLQDCTQEFQRCHKTIAIRANICSLPFKDTVRKITLCCHLFLKVNISEAWTRVCREGKSSFQKETDTRDEFFFQSL